MRRQRFFNQVERVSHRVLLQLWMANRQQVLTFVYKLSARGCSTVLVLKRLTERFPISYRKKCIKDSSQN